MAQLTIQQAFDLALAHHRAGRFGQAEEIYREILVHQPVHADATHLLGVLAHQTGRNELAVDLIRKALAIQPNFPEAYNNLGSALDELDLLDEAIAAYRQAIALRPSYVEAHSNLGVGLKNKGLFDEASAVCRQAIGLNPSLLEPRMTLALVLMLRGDLEGGMQEMKWRLGQKFGRPLWDGSPLDNRTLLIHCDDGLGDTLQFVRYLPLAARRCKRIFVVVQKALREVLARTAGPWQYLCLDDPLPPFDFHISLLCLPLAFKTTVQTVPAEVPYICPDPELVESWRNQLAPLDRQLNVALAWAGNPKFKSDRTRSLSLDRLARLAQVRGVTFYSVQIGEAARQAEHPPDGMRLVKLAPDFPSTAAIMSLMDLMITTDTSMAHLAGGLGKPVWVMLRQIPDFRWLLHREDSPWYPSMRLFRQPARGDWDSVVEEVATALERRVDGYA